LGQRNLNPGLHGKQSNNVNHTLHAIDSARFIAGVTRILVPLKELSGPYGACIATYGSEEDTEKVVVSIVDMKRRLVIDHRTWLISEYGNEASRSVEAAVDALTDDMMSYCERSGVGNVFVIDKPFPLQVLGEKCPYCGEDRVKVPWEDS